MNEYLPPGKSPISQTQSTHAPKNCPRMTQKASALEHAPAVLGVTDGIIWESLIRRVHPAHPPGVLTGVQPRLEAQHTARPALIAHRCHRHLPPLPYCPLLSRDAWNVKAPLLCENRERERTAEAALPLCKPLRFRVSPRMQMYAPQPVRADWRCRPAAKTTIPDHTTVVGRTNTSTSGRGPLNESPRST